MRRWHILLRRLDGCDQLQHVPARRRRRPYSAIIFPFSKRIMFILGYVKKEHYRVYGRAEHGEARAAPLGALTVMLGRGAILGQI